MFQSEKQPDRNTGKRNAENDNNKSKLSNEERYNLFFGNHLQTAQKKEDETEDELQAKMEPNYITGKRQHPETGSQDIVLTPLFSPGSNPAAQKKEEESGMGGLNPIEMLNDQKEAISKGVGMHPVQQKEIEQEKNIQKKPSETDPAKSPSTPMPENVQSKMENSFGTSFSDVSIHTNDEGAKDMGALAYTQGKDVHFAPGQYNPGTQKGQELIGHELTHVVQQREGRVRPTKQGKGLTINDNPALENEADEMGKKAAEGENAAPHQTAGNAVQRKKENSVEPEMSEEQIKSAIDCNNGLGLSALSINYLQSGLCVPQTGAFDENTVLAIGKVSIENRVEPFLADLADAKMREYINNQFDTSISEKDQKKKLKYENKLNKLGPEGSKKKKAKYKGKIQEIKDRYMSSSDQEHLERTKHLGSSANIESKIDDIRSKFTASDGQLDVSTYNTIFRQMAADGAYQQLLNISVEFAGVQQDSKTLFMQYDPASELAYRVKVPFSQLEINNTSTESSITNAPNTLKNVFIGKNAFESHAALIGHIKTANSIQVEPNNEESQETSENNVTELTQEQIESSISDNNFIFSEDRSKLLIQSIVGASNTGTFDEDTIRRISNFQNINNITLTNGAINNSTLNQMLQFLAENNEHDVALLLLKDFYSLKSTTDKEVVLRYSSDINGPFKKSKSLPEVEYILIGSQGFTNGLSSLHSAIKDAFSEERTMKYEMTDTILSNTDNERQSAMWSNPNTTNEDGLVKFIRDQFPEEEDIENYLSRTDISSDEKISTLGALSVELGRLEFLMGVIYHGGTDQSWETDGANQGPFVNYYKSKVGNNVNTSPWCTMFSGYLKRMLGFSEDLSTGGPLIFNSGIRLDRWATDAMNVISGTDDFDDPSDYENYTGDSIDTNEWITLRNDLNSVGLTDEQKRETVSSFLSERILPQPGDILVINPESTTNQYHNRASSHTTTVETFNQFILTTIEGNKSQKVKGTSLNFTDVNDIGKILFMSRIGTEFFPQVNEDTQNEEENQQDTEIITREKLIEPLKIMVRNLQLLADNQNFINSDVENTSVFNMGEGTNDGSTQ